ncbi:MAG: glycosyltransferase family 2 protein [Bacteroidales bacterium]|nr:glycosyltransferase family 2 protein [Bacteroidales bacterium]
MESVAVIIPCYNEALTIRRVVEAFREALPEASVYVYDNNSTDHTADIARMAGAIVKLEPRQGKGNVVRSMFRDIDAHCYLLVDGDDTYPAESARDMVEAVLHRDADMVVGDRLSATYSQQNRRRFHLMGNMLVRWIINNVYKSDIKDVMTGYRAFGYSFVKSFPVLSRGFEIETEMTIHSLDRNLNIQNIPVIYRNRPEGSFSKLNTYDNGLKVLHTIFSLYRNYKPLRFFLWVAFISLAVALSFLTPVLMEFFDTGIVSKLPSFIASVCFAIVSILSVFQGLSLDSINEKDRRDFEIVYGQCRERERSSRS